MSGIRSGSQCQAVARPGLKPCSEVSLHPPTTLPCLCACLGAPTVSTLTPGSEAGGDRACCTSWPCSAAFRVCFLLLLLQESSRLPCQKALLNALLTSSCSFKKRRGHSVGGAPEQRYQSIPVCVAARLPTRAQDVLVRRSWAKCMGYNMGVQVPGVVQGGWGSKNGPLTGSRSFPPTACGGSPLAFYNEGETGGRETRRPGSGVLGTWREAAAGVQSEVMSPGGAEFETQCSNRDLMRDREL